MLRNIRVRVYLVAVAMTLIPTLCAFHAVRNILLSSIAIGINPQIEERLEESGQQLRLLAKTDPRNAQRYRSEFDRLQEVKRTYDLLPEFVPSIRKSLLEVFSVIFGLGLFFALALAWWLNRSIIRSHDAAIAAMKQAKERSAYLENREAWRLVAQKFVHEVKNPLTPVKVMVGRLLGKYQARHSNQDPEFESILIETRNMVGEETDKIAKWVEAFSGYARIPDARLAPLELRGILENFSSQYADYWPNLKISLEPACGAGNLVLCDAMLFKQVLFNLAKNSAEAAGDRDATLSLARSDPGAGMRGLIARDDGPGLPSEVASSVFKPYVGSRSTAAGMGLGLAISKKIMLEHGGDMLLLPSSLGCSFELRLQQGEEHASS